MSNIFELPQEVFNKGYQFYQTYQQVKGSSQLSNPNELLIVINEDKFEIVKNDTIMGKWLEFKSSCIHFFGGETEIDENFKKIHEVFSKIVSIEPAALESFIKNKNPNEQDIQTKIKNFLVFAKSVAEGGLTPPPLQQNVTALSPPTNTMPLFVSFKEKRTKAKDLLSNAFPDLFTSKETKAISAFLVSYADNLELFKSLEECIQNPQKATSSLQLALMQGLSIADNENLATALNKLMTKEGSSQEERTGHKADLLNIGLVLGDAFVEGSGLEGGVISRPYADLAVECLNSLGVVSPEVESLTTVLSQPIDLRDSNFSKDDKKDGNLVGTGLREKIKQNLESLPEGQQRCILFGGWDKHAIVYEVERDAETGLYTFRVYNAGEGIQYHESVQEKYKKKYTGCVAIKDIPEKLLFRRSFLVSLQALCSMPAGEGRLSAPNILFSHILTLLGGKEELIEGTDQSLEPRIQRFLSPQRSGSCTYRSLQAFLAHAMTQKDYKHFKIEYKLFLLDKYLPKLQEKTKTSINDLNEYRESIREYGVLKRSIEKLSNGIEKLGKNGVFYNSELQRARQKILQYEVELKKLDTAIINFEKRTYSNTLSTLSTGVWYAESYLPSIGKEAFQEPKQSNDVNIFQLDPIVFNLLQKIESIPANHSEAEFITRVEDCIASFLTVDKKDLLYVCDHFFKKIGSIAALKEIQFSNPEKSFKELQKLAYDLQYTTEETKFQRIGMCFAAYYAMECAFRQIPDEKRILNKDFPSFFGAFDFSQLIYASCDDPFWDACYQEFGQLQATNTAAMLPDQKTFKDTKFWEFDKETTRAILSWWKSSGNEEKAAESIKKDRLAQEIRIKSETNLFYEELERQKNRLNSAEEQSRNQIQTQIDEINLKISVIEKEFQQDSQYWPWEWEIEGGKIKDEMKASFIFGKLSTALSIVHAKQLFFKMKFGIPDPLPSEIREIYNTAIMLKHILLFRCTQTVNPVKIQNNPAYFFLDIGFNKEDGAIQSTWTGNFVFSGAEHVQWSYNRYFKDFNNEGWQKIFKFLHSTHKDETAIPKMVQEFSKSHTDDKPVISNEEIKDLLSIRQPEIQIDATLGYFRRNLEKLNDHNWFLIFHSFLFEENFLLKELTDPRQNVELMRKLEAFFSEGIAVANKTDNFVLAGNLLWTQKLVQNYIDHASLELQQKGHPPLKQLFFPESVIPLMEKVINPKYQEQWPQFFEAICAASKDITQKVDDHSLDKNVLNYILLANVFRRQHPVVINRISLREEDAENTMKELGMESFTKQPPIITTEAITNFFVKTGENLLQRVFPDLKGFRYEKEGGVYITSDEKQRVCLSSGEIRSTDPKTLRSFKDPLKEDDIEFLKQKGFYGKDEDLTSLRCFIEGNVLYIKDGRKNPELEMIIDKKIGNRYRIYVKIASSEKSQFARFLSGDSKSINNKELQFKYHFCKVGQDVYLCDLQTFAPVYKIDGKTQVVSEISPPNYRLANIPLEANAFRTFEDPSCTSFWADEKGKLQKIEFTRLNVSFAQEIKEGKERWEYQQEKGWYLAKEQFAPHLGPHAGFIVLENDQGKKKVLLPTWDCKKKQPDQKDSLNYPFEYDFKPEEIRQGSIVEYDLSSDSTKLIPKSLEARYYLGYIYLEKGFQDLAEALLDDRLADSSHRPLTASEQRLLENIVVNSPSGNKSAWALRLRLHAFYLLEQNRQVFHFSSSIIINNEKELDDYWNGKLTKRSLVIDYLNRLGHMKPLGQNEELLILSQILKNDSPYIEDFALRLDINERERSFFLELFSQDTIFELRQSELTNTTSLDDYKPEISSGDYLMWIVWLDEIKAKRESKQSEILSGQDYQRLKKTSVSIPDRFDYWKARLSNTFPFDYADENLDENTFFKYFPLIQKERREYNESRMSMLHYLSLFCKNDKIKRGARSLLNDSYHTPLSFQKIIRHSDEKRVKPSSIKREEISFRKGVQNLQQLSLTPPSVFESSYLPARCKDYFDQGKNSRFQEVKPELFKSDSPLAKANQKQFETAAAELEKGANLLETNTFTLKPDKVLTNNGLRDDIEKTLGNEKKSLAKQEMILLQSVNSALTIDPRSKFTFTSKKRSLPTVQELCVLCARRNSEQYISEIYPELSNEGIQKLKAAVKNLLIQKQYVQHLERSIEKIDDIAAARSTASEETLAVMMNDLGSSLEVGRNYYVDTNELALTYLVVETSLNIKLHKGQVENIEKLYEGLQTGKEIAQQMIMGSGKTAVIQPILAFLFAEPGSISTVCVPKELLPEVLKKLYGSLGESFNQYVFRLPFDRSLSKNEAYLDTFLKRLRKAKESGACILQTPQEKHAIQASLIEAYYKERIFSFNKDSENILEICRELRISETSQVDEIDKVMDPGVAYKFPVGESKKIDSQTASIASEIVIRLASDRSFCEQFSVDFCDAFQKRLDPNYIPKGKQLIPELYETLVQPKLVKIALDLLIKKGSKDSEFFAKLLNNNTSRSHLELFLIKSPPPDATIAWLQENLEGEQRELLGACAIAIREILPKSLFKEYGSQYGQDPNKDRSYLACSYNAPNDPKKTIRKGYEQVIYSTQQVLMRGIPEDAVKEMLKAWQTQAKADQLIIGNILKTKGYRRFEKALGPEMISKFNLNFQEDPPQPQLIEFLKTALNSSPVSLLKFMQDFAFNQIIDYPNSISRTNVETFGFAKKTYAYTGTMQPAILTRTMEAHKEKGTDGKTIAAVDLKIKRGEGEIVLLNRKTDLSYTEQVSNAFIKDEKLFVFIDSGNWLKEEKLQPWARGILERCRNERKEIEGILIPNEKDEWISLEYINSIIVEVPMSQSKLRPEQRLTIIPSKFETGTDIKQKPTAKAFVSVRKDMTLRDTLQSVFRMRQILLGQSVSFGISEEVKAHIFAHRLQDLFKQEPWNSLLNNSALSIAEIDDLKVEGELENQVKEALKLFLKKNEGLWQKLDRDGRYVKFIDIFGEAIPILPSDVLWDYFLVNQIKDEQEKAWLAGCQKMHSVVSMPVFMVLIDKEIDYQDRIKFYREIESLLITTTEESLFEKMSTKTEQVKGKEGRKNEVERHLTQFKELYKKIKNQKVKQKFENNIKDLYCTDKKNDKRNIEEILKNTLEGCINLDDISDVVTVGKNNDSDEMELELEREREKEMEKEKEKELEMNVVAEDLKEIAYQDLTRRTDIPSLLFKSLDHFDFSKLDDIETLLPENNLKGLFEQETYSIKASPNLILSQSAKAGFIGSSSHASYRLSGNYILVCKKMRPEKDVYVLISNEDAAKMKPILLNSPDSKDMILVSITDDIHTKIPSEVQFDTKDANFQRVVVQAKLLNGNPNFSKEELAILENDIIGNRKNKQEAAKQLKDMFDIIVSYMESSIKMYNISPLRKLFTRLCNENAVV